MRGLFCVDPGAHTGLAWSIIDETKKTASEAMRARLYSGSDTIEGKEPYQIRTLYDRWITFKRYCVTRALLDPEQVEIIFEDFVLRGGQHAGGKDGTIPERISWGFEGYRMSRFDTWRKGSRSYTPIIWQQPSAASTYKTRSRLTNCDAWIKGREHERSAMSHMILRVNTLLDMTKLS